MTTEVKNKIKKRTVLIQKIKIGPLIKVHISGYTLPLINLFT